MHVLLESLLADRLVIEASRLAVKMHRVFSRYGRFAMPLLFIVHSAASVYSPRLQA